MKKVFIMLFCAVCALSASAQTATRYMRVSQLDGTVTKFAINTIDSIDFVMETEKLTHNGHEYVDLGLPSGTLWATCNIGAESPEECGDYFAWGETEPKPQSQKQSKSPINKSLPTGGFFKHSYEDVCNEANYSWCTYKFCNYNYDKDSIYFTKYWVGDDLIVNDSNLYERGTITFSGKIDKQNVLCLEDDAAHVNWGGD